MVARGILGGVVAPLPNEEWERLGGDQFSLGLEHDRLSWSFIGQPTPDTVFDNVALPLIIAGHGPDEVGRRVRAALDKVGLLNKEKLNPMVLSGGELQRVGIARAVVNKPPLLLADEPTGNLDPELSAEIMDIFKDFARVGVAVLIGTHDLGLIARYPHRLLSLSQGQLITDRPEAAHGA